MEGYCNLQIRLMMRQYSMCQLSKTPISLEILEGLTATKPMVYLSNPYNASTNCTKLSNQRRQVPRRRGGIATRSAQPQQQSISAKGQSSEPMNALIDRPKLLSLVPTRCAGITEYVTATESMPPSSRIEVAIASASSARGVSARVEGLMKARSEYASAVEFEIEASKVHWSELTDATTADSDDDETGESDQEVWARLQQTHPTFFGKLDWMEWNTWEKIAEGGQAEIFKDKSGAVLKVMKEGYRLRDLEKQWPPGMLHNLGYSGTYESVACCLIFGAMLLKNGRFAFGMMNYWGDLRRLIDMRMECNYNQCPPFSKEEIVSIVEKICCGMEELHQHNIVHRDLKASNVLIGLGGEEFDIKKYGHAIVHVADFECSVGVVGTGYWRAPEILQGVQQGDIKPELFTEKSDVYAFGMTLYEVLTGRIPFEELGGRCYDVVIEGRRPQLLKNIDPRWKELLKRCWHGNPLERPSFTEIGDNLRDMFPSKGITSFENVQIISCN